MATDTLWSSKDLPPKHAPIYTRSRPIRSGWKWRSSKAIGENGETYVLLVLCNPGRGKWQAILMLETADRASVIARFEDHADHPGLHIHTDCERAGAETGATGLDNLRRIPSTPQFHRRVQAWTENNFWEAAKRFFRVKEMKGPLI